VLPSFATLPILQSKSTQNVQFFLWLNFNVPLATTAPLNNMFSHACAAVFRRTRYDDMHFKQLAVTEFLVAENELATKIHKQLQNV
jgi:hypothetical protein